MKETALPIAGSVLLVFVGLMSFADSCLAQQTVSPCQPPQANEYLLLVLSKSLEIQEHLQRTLPANTQTTFCRYLDDKVTRIAGFRSLDNANSWARYVKEIVGLSAFVVRPTQATLPTNSLAYNPQPLGEGYAVLVDYLNQPEIAIKLKQILGKDVGLVSFGQRPYLLASYTTNQREANSVLRKLSDRGFWSMLVDSNRVTLLRSVISF
ncbi:MAG TPA: hypothetical protein DCE56_44425 [Cyanobacteria bacterium UBA8553]|nr:hypothetical protein [Cyanobacteria bacterium UBA8553]HAJ63339.1 hypothetical protein [Cyanobacteria bacterium UBA8543]